ncbi:MAG TPA: SpoIIE family protein phosphatase [Acidimicrobiales bacterium]|nr:SpoIIE family protein phosphatase [Acidimicrobiales bacterium]
MPRARRFARDQARDEIRDDLELVVTELVTNAVLYGDGPIALRIYERNGLTRAEVRDQGKLLPVQALSRPDNMTGRGLGLIASLCETWGWEPLADGGKVVWAEIRPAVAGDEPLAGRPVESSINPSSQDMADLLALWPDLDQGPAEAVCTVRLGPVPTDLLVDAKSHIDNLVRELTLAGGGPGAASHPPPVAHLIDTVTNSFAEARAEMKRQAIAASNRGDAVTELVLHLPTSAAEAAEKYMDALDESDRYAKAARLLTLAAPPAHRVFRRWYLSQVVAQLRAYEAGHEPPQPPSFADALAEEVTRLSALQEAWDRLQLLEKVTGELRDAPSLDEVARIFTRNAVDLLGAIVVRVYLLGDDRVLRAVAAHGNGEQYSELPLEADYPASMVARTGQRLVLHGRESIDAAFPPLARNNPVDRNLHLVPLKAGHGVIGCLALSFPAGSEAEETSQTSFLTALADTLAQALQRAVAMGKLAQANERLSFLAAASVALSSSLDPAATARAVARTMVPRLADWCVVHIVEGDKLVPLAVEHVDPARAQWAREISARYPTLASADTAPARAVRTGRAELFPVISTDKVEARGRDAEHRQALRQLGVTSCLVAPLVGRGGPFGALTMLYSGSGRQYSADDLPFAEDVARRAAMALETARLFEDQTERLASVTSIAQVAQQAILAPLPAAIGAVRLSARYLSATAEAQVGGDLYEAVARPGAARLLIGDVKGKGLGAVRTTTVVLGEFRAAAADQDDLPAVAAQIDRRLHSFLEPEDFVTAVIAEISDDGTLSFVSCGHPAPLLVHEGALEELGSDHGLPLGLGGTAKVARRQLVAGDRVLLYTDGIMEARDEQRRFVELHEMAKPVVDAAFDRALDDVLRTLAGTTGPHLGDDLALLLAEYGPWRAGSGRPGRP